MPMSSEEMKALKMPELKNLCRDYNLRVSGKKDDLCQRILAHQWKMELKKQRLELADEIATKPDGSVDDEFEIVIKNYFDWCKKNHFAAHEIAEGGYSYKKVDYREIRASFKEYDPDASTLREDKYVPVPQNKMEVFIEMFFDKLGGEWEMFDINCGEVEFDEGVEERFSKEMKEGFATSLTQWYATNYANNRD